MTIVWVFRSLYGNIGESQQNKERKLCGEYGIMVSVT